MYREVLKCGEKLNINGDLYLIEKVLGIGGNIIAYKAKNQAEYDNNYYVVKEFYPKHVNLVRKGELDFFLQSDVDKVEFEKSKQEYISSTKQHVEIRNNINEVMNSTISARMYFEHNTCYVVEPLFNGTTYDDCNEKNIQDLLKRIKALCKVISGYHNNGYLHLDIKPSNVYVIPETCEYVFLIDLDSVVKEEKLKDIRVRYSDNWAAPEQIMWDGIDKITKATDIYAIGEVLFYKLFGRHSKDTERRPFSKYDYSGNSLIKGLNPKVEVMMTELFHHTLCYNLEKRYQSVDTLISKLDEMLDIVKNPIYLTSTHLVKNPNYISRDEDSEKLTDMLGKTDRIMISGWGGIGKSEFIKNYFVENEEQYDVVIYHSYDDNWLNFVTKGIYQNICGYLCDADEMEIQFEKIIKMMSDLSNGLKKKTVIIVDNVTKNAFLEGEEKYRRILLNMNVIFIFISRENIECKEFSLLGIDRMNNEKLFQIIEKNTEVSYEEIRDDKGYLKIIDYFGGHTLAVELVAKMMHNELLEPDEMIDKLMMMQLNKIKEKVMYEKDGTNKGDKSTFEHIVNIFDISSLTKDEIDILSNMSVLPSSGINIKLFKQYVKLTNMNIVNNLINKGWIRREDTIIMVHPLISEVVCSLKVRRYRKLLKNLLYYYVKLNGDFTLEERKIHSEIIISIREKLKRQKNKTEEFFDFLEMDNQYSPLGIFELRDGYEYGLELMKNNRYNEVKQAKAYLNYGNIQEYFCGVEEVRKYYLKGKEILENKQEYLNIVEYPLALFLLGSTYGENNKTRALSYLDDAMQRIKKLKMSKEVKLLMADVFGTQAYIIERNGNSYDYEQVIQLRKQAIQCYYDCFEGESIWTALSYCKLARNYIDYNDIDQAEKYCKRALLIYTSLLGDNGYETAFSYQVMGEIYQKCSRYSDAKNMYEKALYILRGYWNNEDEDNCLQIKDIKDSLNELDLLM